MLKIVEHEKEILAIIISNEYEESGIHFFTPEHFSQQLAFMKHPTGKKIKPHIHKMIEREVFYTQEVLFIKKGSLKVDIYTNDQQYIESHILTQGDVIMLAAGGHGFEVLEELQMIEVKQGPYVAEEDKIRFSESAV